MAIPVKFYSVTAQEYERIRQEMLEACHAQEMQEEAERKKDLEGGIFFVEDNKVEGKGEDHAKTNGEIRKVD